MPDESLPSNPPDSSGFPATRWSLVRAAREGDTSVARRALGEICQGCWYPLYAYARRRGLTPEDAEDCTQEFFRNLIARESLRTAAPEHGRLRAFLLAAMKRHMAGEYRKATAQKRGDGRPAVSIDTGWAESRLMTEPSHQVSPDLLFDQSWAHSVLEAALKDLRAWYVRMKRGDLFDAIQDFLAWNEGGPSYQNIAGKLHTTEQSVRSAVHSMRQRYRRFIDRQITDTVTTAEEAKAEIAYLCRVLAGDF